MRQALPVARRQARRANGRYPDWFREWVDAEQLATALRTWQPILVPGLLQTPGYARVLFQAWQPTATSDDLDALVSARIERRGPERPGPRAQADRVAPLHGSH